MTYPISPRATTLMAAVVGMAVCLSICPIRLSAVTAWTMPQEQDPEKKDPKIDFQREIQPILAKRCTECHGEEKEEGDLRTDKRESVLDEYFVLPGKAEESLFYKVIVSSEDDRMPPPDEGEPVPAEEAALIKAWIDQGAVWPEDVDKTAPPSGANVAITKPLPPVQTPPGETVQEPADEPQPATPESSETSKGDPGPPPPVGQPSAGNQESSTVPKTTPPLTGDTPVTGDTAETGGAAPSAKSETPQETTQPPPQPGAGEQPSPSQGGDTSAPAKELSAQQVYWLKVWQAFGELHPATAHFPIALLIVGALSALFSFRGSYACADFAFYCLWLGALGAIATAGLGWAFAWNEGYNEDPFLFDRGVRLFWHRWTGVVLAILSFLVALVATISRRRDPENGSLWRFGLIALAVLTAYVGHAGGELTHRRGYDKIWKLFGAQDEPSPVSKKKFESAGDKQ